MENIITIGVKSFIGIRSLAAVLKLVDDSVAVTYPTSYDPNPDGVNETSKFLPKAAVFTTKTAHTNFLNNFLVIPSPFNGNHPESDY
jgi:hypothetical protein